MAAMGSGLKFLEGLRHPRIRLFVAIVSSLVLSLILGLFIDLFFGNLHGALNRENRQWFIVDLPKNVFNYGVLLNQERPGISWIGWVASAAGACIMLILIVLRRGVLWWPLHPIGFAISGTWMMRIIWFNAFLAWVIKFSLVRYGGPRLYRKSVPLFIGFIVGQSVCMVMWLIIDGFTGKRGNVPFGWP